MSRPIGRRAFRRCPGTPRPTLSDVRALESEAQEAGLEVGKLRSAGASEVEVRAARYAYGLAHVRAELAALAAQGDGDAARLLEGTR